MLSLTLGNLKNELFYEKRIKSHHICIHNMIQLKEKKKSFSENAKTFQTLK